MNIKKLSHSVQNHYHDDIFIYFMHKLSELHLLILYYGEGHD